MSSKAAAAAAKPKAATAKAATTPAKAGAKPAAAKPAAAKPKAAAAAEEVGPAMALKFSAVPRKADHDGPVLACFPGGAPAQAVADAREAALPSAETSAVSEPLLAELYAPIASASSSATAAAAAAAGRRSHRTLAADTRQCSYVAHNFGVRAHHQEYYHRYAVGLVDASAAAGAGSGSKTLQVQLLDVPHVFVLNQTVKAVAAAEAAAAAAKEEEDAAASSGSKKAAEDWAIKRKLLVEGFGSRKRMRAFRSEEAGKVQLTNSTAAMGALEKALAEPNPAAAAADGDDEDANASLSSVLPPFDLKTEDVNKIYDVKKILPAAAWKEAAADKSLAPLLKGTALTINTDANRDAFGPYVVALAAQLSTKTAQQRRDAAPCLTYIHQLLTFLALDPKHKDSGLKGQSTWGESTKELIRNTFTQQQTRPNGQPTRVLTDTLRDRLLCYVLVLSLYCSGHGVWELPHSVVVGALCQQLRFDEKKVIAYVQEVGCRMSGKGDTKLWRLNAPLQLSINRKGGKPKTR